MRPSRALVVAALLAALGSCKGERPGAPAGAPGSTLTVTVFQLRSHGLAIALRTPAGKTYLIDAGSETGAYNAGRDTVAPWLKARGVARLDGIVISHPDRDHYGGAAYLLENVGASRFIDAGMEGEGVHKSYLRLRHEVQSRGVSYSIVSEGEALDWDPALKVEVLSPPKGLLKPAAAEEKKLTNDNSLVLRVQHGKNVFLFPGDIQSLGRNHLLDAYRADRLKSTVLVAPHHGFSHGKRFAEIAKPELVIVSCKAEYADKGIASPGREAKDFFGAVGARVLVTAFDGTVEVTSDGDTVRVKTEPAEAARPEAPGR